MSRRGRTEGRPAPDASFQTDDVTEFALRPDPEVLAHRQREEAQAQALRANLSDRDRIDAEFYGVPLVAWQMATDAARKEIIAAHNRRTPGDAGMVKHTINHGELGGSRDALENQYTRAVNELNQDKAEALSKTILCRPVVNHPRWGLIHQPPGIVKVPRRQVGKALTKGFTYNPEPGVGFIPDPDVVCEICLEANVDPPFVGYSDAGDPRRSRDIERHQKARHPEEFDARDRQRTRIGQEDLHGVVALLSERMGQQGDAIERLLTQIAQQQGA